MLRQAYGNPYPNNYDTHIVMHTNCIVFLSTYDNSRHYCKICKANLQSDLRYLVAEDYYLA